MSLSHAYTPIDSERLAYLLQAMDFSAPYQLHYFNEIDSTNRYLQDHPASSTLQLCCTESQTAGRGRFMRQWHSPIAENIYFSGRWPWPTAQFDSISCLSLITGLAVIASLVDYAIAPPLQIKWPNDILWQGKKLAGILIELKKNSASVTKTQATWDVIIGIGINVNSLPSSDYPQDKPWCALRDILQTPTDLDRTELLARLITTLHQHIHVFQEQGMAAFMNDWQRLDYLRDHCITLSQANTEQTGWARGINLQGQLLLEDAQGNIEGINAGEASLTGLT